MKTDVQLQRDVLEELDWEPSIDAAQIGVTVQEGVVTLTGHVPVYAEKHAAEETVKRVHGVRGVANEIDVRPTESHVRDDAELAAAAVHALQWHASVPGDQIQVTVEDGWIRLEGTVEHQYQRAAADRAVRHMVGARGVTNAISVEPEHSAAEVRESIEAAFRRSAMIDSKMISIETDGHLVTLTGEVHSHREMEEAERTAWSARGVREVANCLIITPWGFGPAEEWGY